MVVRVIEILLEYIAIILCVHKITGLKLVVNKWNVSLLCIDYIIMLSIICGIVSPYIRCFIYGLIIVYIKIITEKGWNKAISIFGSVVVVIVSLQFGILYIFKILHINLEFLGSLINLTICILICIWKQKYFYSIVKFLNATKGIIISILYVFIFVQMIYLGENYGRLRMEIAVQFLAETIGLSIISILWIGSEIKTKQKIRELQMYEMYNQAYEETIVTIRARQHEFENHLNTIKCMSYVIKDKEELIKAQVHYCDSLLNDNSLNQLLKLRLEPAVVGFLYSKIITANEKGIYVKYNIQSKEINNRVLVYEFIEIIGVLFDNAMEALEESEDKKIILIISDEGESCFSVEVANRSRIYQNNEIEKFTKSGYSTKGENRGMGLTRVRKIIKKYKATLKIGNYYYNNDNYLRFKIEFKR